jgi:hypothetical protein
VEFEYGGATALTVVSPLTGKTYLFARPGMRVDVDPRDCSWVVFVPNLKRTVECNPVGARDIEIADSGYVDHSSEFSYNHSRRRAARTVNSVSAFSTARSQFSYFLSYDCQHPFRLARRRVSGAPSCAAKLAVQFCGSSLKPVKVPFAFAGKSEAVGMAAPEMSSAIRRSAARHRSALCRSSRVRWPNSMKASNGSGASIVIPIGNLPSSKSIVPVRGSGICSGAG